ncbi:zinc finger C2H2 domain-containing protein [Vairimorpha necatrix]|uniref:Zinc finger C2H2 domain-containing protein n=1 Tax=Vairimorpha necatrix TaxID=6039 RepID=A0AAX4JD77_9MICR
MNYKKMREEYEQYLNKKYQKNYDIHQSPGFSYKPAVFNFGLYQTAPFGFNEKYLMKYEVDKVKRERIQNVITINGQSYYNRDGRMYNVYYCDYPGCFKKYMSKYSLKYHVEKGHTPDNLDVNKPYACNFCGCSRRYKNKSTLVKHVADSHYKNHNN